MSPFEFHPIQTLDIGEKDSPCIDIQAEHLILTATRGNDRIRITAPLSGMLPNRASTPAPTEKVKKAPAAKRPNKYRAQVQTWGFKAGEQSPNSKLKENEVREIKVLAQDPSYLNTFSSEYAAFKDLAKVYRVHYTTIYQIVRGATWKHVVI